MRKTRGFALRIGSLGISSGLLIASMGLAGDPTVGPGLGSSPAASEPMRHDAEMAKPTLIGVRPLDPDEILGRLDRAENLIAELQAENRRLRDREAAENESVIQQTGFNPLHVAPLFSAHDPEIGIIGEQTYSAPPPVVPPSTDPKSKVEAPKPKKWFEKLSIRGYAQVRLNEETHRNDNSARAQYVGDRSIGDNQNFLIRRARVIISGDVHEHLYVYLQPDFASSPGSAADPNNQFVQIRDWYGDFYLDEEKELRIRVGQSKVPYGWENMQSSSNRLPLDRADALNSAVKNERDLGVYFFYTPTWAQDFFKEVLDKGYKGSGNYGLLSAGVYNGQGGSLNEINDDVHAFARVTLPIMFEDWDQLMEVSLQGYTGEYAVVGRDIDPDGGGPGGVMTPVGTVSSSGSGATQARDGWNDQRLAATFVYYPQPFGFQTEWTVGRGPRLNPTKTAIEESSLYGGYGMFMYKHDTENWGTFFPFARYSYFKGGYKSEPNAPFVNIDEWELGTEWQINPAAELTMSYLITNRTNTSASSSLGSTSYGQWDGQALRLQFQINY